MQRIAIILICIILFFILSMIAISFMVYEILLVRTSPSKWSRRPSDPKDKVYLKMFEEGQIWVENNKQYAVPVEVLSDGLKLRGDYYDFGFKKAVLIISGRTEPRENAYYFAETYEKLGFNVLAIDNRAHGDSEGRITSLGFKEYRDIEVWLNLLDTKFGISDVIIYGTCIGGCTALFAAIDDNCNKNLKALIVEGMYVNFFESLKNHMIEQKRPFYHSVYIIAFFMHVISEAPVMRDGPLNRIDRLKLPILFLHSREDPYSTPENIVKIYEKCVAPKKLVFFDHGNHSQIRPNNKEGFDRAVEEFLSKYTLI